MSLYEKYILPRLLDHAMGSIEIGKLRPSVINQATGIVLEIGSGSGYNIPLYKNISKLYALEPSEKLTALAKNKISSVSFPVEFIKAKAEDVPLEDNSVDTIVSTWTLCSLDNPQKSLEEIARVLRPGGRFIFIEHGLSPKTFISRLQRILTPVNKLFSGNCHLDRDIQKIITRAGFTIQNLEQSSEKSKPLVYNSKGIGMILKGI